MAPDQSHDQSYKYIGEGRAADVLDDPAALRRQMLAEPEFARAVNEF